jgi:mannosyl-oligosaccharide alpha-1,2-mannosidase
MGGLLALGAYTDPLGLDSPRAQRDLKTGRVCSTVARLIAL